MLTLNHHKIAFGERTLISNLSLELNQGNTLCVLGRNGVGKSSLLNSFFTNNESILWNSKTLDQFSKKHLSRLIAILKHGSRPSYDITVEEYIKLGRIPYTSYFRHSIKKEEYEPFLDVLHIKHLLYKNTQYLSDGEFQKVQIVRALVQDTPIILLDEPTSFLDFPSKIELYRNLKILSQKMNKIFIFSSHDIDMAWKFSNYTLILDGQGDYSFQQSTLLTAKTLNTYFETDHFYFNDQSEYIIK